MSEDTLMLQLARNLADALLLDNGAKVSMYLSNLSKLRQIELGKRQEILREQSTTDPRMSLRLADMPARERLADEVPPLRWDRDGKSVVMGSPPEEGKKP